MILGKSRFPASPIQKVKEYDNFMNRVGALKGTSLPRNVIGCERPINDSHP